MAFHYQDGELFAEQVNLEKLAQEVGTPFYCYSQRKLADNFGAYMRALAPFHPAVCYSVKANANLAVVRAIAAMGGGADVVSGG